MARVWLSVDKQVSVFVIGFMGRDSRIFLRLREFLVSAISSHKSNCEFKACFPWCWRLNPGRAHTTSSIPRLKAAFFEKNWFCVCGGVLLPQQPCWGQRRTCRSSFTHSTMCGSQRTVLGSLSFHYMNLGIELRSSDLLSHFLYKARTCYVAKIDVKLTDSCFH